MVQYRQEHNLLIFKYTRGGGNEFRTNNQCNILCSGALSGEPTCSVPYNWDVEQGHGVISQKVVVVNL